MRYFANPSTPAVRKAMIEGKLGGIYTPKQGNRMVPGIVWCADNGCFGKGYPGDEAWLLWLASRTPEERAKCVFATAPDVVGDGEATLQRSRPFLPRIRALGYPAALVAQDGMTILGIPWDEFDVLFVGGSTEWKLGAEAAELILYAKSLGKAVHMGRVNSWKRIQLAASLGVDSSDGTFIAFGPDKNLPIALSWVDRLNREAT